MPQPRDPAQDPSDLRDRLRNLDYAPLPLIGKRPAIDAWQTKFQTNTG
jgi:hypothetical protein